MSKQDCAHFRIDIAINYMVIHLNTFLLLFLLCAHSLFIFFSLDLSNNRSQSIIFVAGMHKRVFGNNNLLFSVYWHYYRFCCRIRFFPFFSSLLWFSITENETFKKCHTILFFFDVDHLANPLFHISMHINSLVLS